MFNFLDGIIQGANPAAPQPQGVFAQGGQGADFLDRQSTKDAMMMAGLSMLSGAQGGQLVGEPNAMQQGLSTFGKTLMAGRQQEAQAQAAAMAAQKQALEMEKLKAEIGSIGQPSKPTFMMGVDGNPVAVRWNPQTGSAERVAIDGDSGGYSQAPMAAPYEQSAPSGGGVFGDVMPAPSQSEGVFNIPQSNNQSSPLANKAYVDTMSKDTAEFLKKLSTTSDEIAKERAAIDAYGQTIGKYDTGGANSLIYKAGEWLGEDVYSKLGGNPDELKNYQVAEGVSAGLALTSKPDGSGAMSDRDLDIYLKTAPNANDSVDAQITKKDLREALLSRAETKLSFAQQAAQKGMYANDIQSEWNKFTGSLPYEAKVDMNLYNLWVSSGRKNINKMYEAYKSKAGQ